jgi:serine/threonine-protein kinase
VDDDRLVGERLGGFEILGVAGRGAWATLYRAQQLSLDRIVALKVLDPVLARDPDATRRFLEEGRRAATLDDPAIVPVYEAGEEDGRFYLAMRFVQGETLADEIARGPLTRERTLEVAAVVASALDHAHARGVFHRDVKPGNILIEDDRIFLSDFGIAVTAQTAGKYTTGAIGTAAYMAPEQAQAGPIDGRADLYGLGCVLFECLTSRPPFTTDDLVALLYAHKHDAVPSAGDPALDAFFLRALAKDPADRFDTGAELVAALTTAFGGTIVAPPVVRAPARAQRGARPRMLAAAGVAMLAVIGGVIAYARRDTSSSAAGCAELPANVERAAPGRRGPVIVQGPQCARYTVPTDWSVDGVGPGASVSLTRNGADAVLLSAEPRRGRSSSQVAADSTSFPCPKAKQTTSYQLDGYSGVLCQFNNGTDVFYTTVGNDAWVVSIKANVPATERLKFLQSLTIPSS